MVNFASGTQWEKSDEQIIDPFDSLPQIAPAAGYYRNIMVKYIGDKVEEGANEEIQRYNATSAERSNPNAVSEKSAQREGISFTSDEPASLIEGDYADLDSSARAEYAAFCNRYPEELKKFGLTAEQFSA